MYQVTLQIIHRWYEKYKVPSLFTDCKEEMILSIFQTLIWTKESLKSMPGIGWYVFHVYIHVFITMSCRWLLVFALFRLYWENLQCHKVLPLQYFLIMLSGYEQLVISSITLDTLRLDILRTSAIKIYQLHIITSGNMADERDLNVGRFRTQITVCTVQMLKIGAVWT